MSYLDNVFTIRGDQFFKEEKYQLALGQYNHALKEEFSRELLIEERQDEYVFALSNILICGCKAFIALTGSVIVESYWNSISKLEIQFQTHWTRIKDCSNRYATPERVQTAYLEIAAVCEHISDLFFFQADQVKKNESEYLEELTQAKLWMERSFSFLTMQNLPIRIEQHLGYFHLLEVVHKARPQKYLLEAAESHLKTYSAQLHETYTPEIEFELISYKLRLAVKLAKMDEGLALKARGETLIKTADLDGTQKAEFRRLSSTISKKRSQATYSYTSLFKNPSELLKLAEICSEFLEQESAQKEPTTPEVSLSVQYGSFDSM